MTPADLRMAADTLSGEARGRLLERADVVEDLLARIAKTDGGQVCLKQLHMAALQEWYTKALHVTPAGSEVTISPTRWPMMRVREVRGLCVCGDPDCPGAHRGSL